MEQRTQRPELTAHPLRVIFAGTPDFARTALESLLAAGHAVTLVLTQPDRPAGRGMKLQSSPVKRLALDHAIAVSQPRSLRLDGKFPDDAMAAQSAIALASADVMVVAAYGLILPQWVLQAPRLGCLNIHASLLPRWRGAAPIHRAIEAGDAQTGVTIMQMDAGLDTGDMLLAGRIDIAPGDTTGSLSDKLAALGARLILQALERAGRGALQPVRQPEAGISYARKIDKGEAAVDWAEPAGVIERRIRAFDPVPGATSRMAAETIKLWRSSVVSELPVQGAPGTVLRADATGVLVACGRGALCVTELQRPGGRRLAASDFLRGFDLQPGMVFGQAAA
jgi:methionyl-tRNA formyltransferase